MWEASGTRQVAGSPLLIGSKSAWRVARYNKRVQLHKIWDQVQFTANTKNSILHILHMLCNRRHCCCSTWPGVLFNSFVWTYDLPLELHALTLATCWGRESGSIYTQYQSANWLMRICNFCCVLIWSTEVMFLRLEIDTMLQLHFMVTWVAVYCGRGGRIYLLHFTSTVTWVAVYFLFHRDLYFLGVCDLDGTMNSSFNTGPAGYSANSLSTEHATFHTSLDSILEEES